MHFEHWSSDASAGMMPALGLGNPTDAPPRRVPHRRKLPATYARREGRIAELRPQWTIPAADWLTEAERRELLWCRDAARREAWLCGRRLAKELILEVLDGRAVPWREVEIRSRDGAGRSVPPTITIGGRPLPWRLSISSSDRAALVALTTRPDLSVGVDLPRLQEPRDPATLIFWFSRQEQREFRLTDPRQMALCWAIKEAAYKACNGGESFVPRRFEVLRTGPHGLGCRYDGPREVEVRTVETWETDGQIAVAVVAARPEGPRVED